MKKAVLTGICVFITSYLSGQVGVTRLRTEYQTTPMGIETEAPRLSWVMETDRYGAKQTAYRIVSALQEDELSKGNYIYDSGKVAGSASVSIPYKGAIQAATRYYWKVFVWDEQGNISSSESAWFETGLMDNGWDGAEWIGSHEIILSKYRTDFTIEFDVDFHGNEAVFVFGAKNERNFVSFGIDNDLQEIRLEHFIEDRIAEDGRADISHIAGRDAGRRHIRLDINCPHGKNYIVAVSVDGITVKDPRTGRNEFHVHMDNGDPNSNTDRLDLIGYNQPEGQAAVFSNLTIGEKKWNTAFFTDTSRVAAQGFRIWDPVNASAPMLRKSFEVEKPIEKARLYATSRGIYEIEINGHKVGNDYYNPGWTVYRDRIMYNTFDVTDYLVPGVNGIGAVLGAGWWNDFVGMTVDPEGVSQSFLCKLVIEYVDGTTKTVVSDGTWGVYDHGPVISNGMQTGQEYDARRETADWTTGNFDASEWKKVKVFDPPGPATAIQAYVGETIKNNITLTARSMSEPSPGVYIYDMGVNMVGIPRLSNITGRPGQVVTLRFAEMLWPETIPVDPVPPYTVEEYRRKRGQMYTDNYRAALSRDRYILKGDPGGETFEPTLTQHGYRYIEITGLDRPLALADVKGIVLESIGEQLSWYETSNENIDRLFENIVWGQRGNFLSIPTDCPQRDERMGWLGDAQVFTLTSTYNMMTDGFFSRWMHTLRDTQGDNGSFGIFAPLSKGGDAMGWMEAGIIVPWQIYQQYGDLRILEEHYGSMTRYMDFLGRRATGFIQPGGLFGDWLALVRTSTSLTNTAYYACDALLMELIACALGKPEDGMKYARLYKYIKAAWNKTFVDEAGYTIDPGNDNVPLDQPLGDPPPVDPLHPQRIDTQSSYAVPLRFDLFDESHKPMAVKHLADRIRENGYKLNTGFIGTPYLCNVLSDNGHSDVAYRLFEQNEYPSWLSPVTQGATTIWERWNSYTIENGFGPVGMNSFNHYAYGAIEEWMMQYTLGIQRDEANPGYKHFYLKPEIGGTCSYIRGGFESIYGKISSGWEKNDNGYIYRASVPANTTATLTLPLSGTSNLSVREGSAGASEPRIVDQMAIIELKAGKYEFVVCH